MSERYFKLGDRENFSLNGITKPASACHPNPFVSYGRMVGREHEEFVLRDHAGREVGRFRGARIGVGLPAGVYFAASTTSPGTQVRVVKTR